MAKNKISEYSTTALSNSDVGGIGILGTNLPENFDNALREIMKQIADLNTGASFIHDTYKIADSDEETRLAKFDAGSITAGQTRTFTFPDKNGTFALAADVAAIDSSDDGSKNTALNIPSGTTAQEPSSPDGVQIRYDTDIGTLRLYNGTSYTSFGAGALKYDEAQTLTSTEKQQASDNIGRVSWEHISTTDVSSAVSSVDFTNLSGFDTIRITFWAKAATDSVWFMVRTSGDNGSSWTSSGYRRVASYGTSGGVTNSYSASDSFIGIVPGLGNASAEYCQGEIVISRFNEAATSILRSSSIGFDSVGNPRIIMGGGIDAVSGARDGVRLLMSSGNISTGTFILEGIRS